MANKIITFTGDPMGKKIATHYEKLVSKHANKWDIDIVMCVCHGDYSRAPQQVDFDKLYLFVQLLPKLAEGMEKTKIKYFRINGEKLEFPVKTDTPNTCPQGDSLKFKSLPEESHLITDDEDNPVAVVYDSAIYFLNDFIHCRDQRELDISVAIFDHVVKEAIEKTALLNNLKAGVEQKSKKALIEALKLQFSQRLEKEKIALKATKDTIDQYQKGIVDCSRKSIAAEAIVMTLQNNLGNISRALDKTWLEIRKLEDGPMYESISFMKTGIKARSIPIIITSQDRKYDMGRYEVILGFDGSTKIYSLDKAENLGTTDHPHISGGNPCWGNFAGEIPKRIGYGEFDVALVLIHTFLSHYDSASPYRAIEYWPLVKQEKTKKEEANV